MTESGRTCTRCGTHYAAHLVDVAFKFNRLRLDASSRKTICRPCEQTARDARKVDNRWAVKARDVIRRHAIRLAVPKADLVGQYGWEPGRLAHDAEHQYGNGCNYCGSQYQAMGHGLADITLDVVDRGRPPYYRTNTKWCCNTCNRKKGVLSPESFELDRHIYEVWNQHHQLPADERGMLFDLPAV